MVYKKCVQACTVISFKMLLEMLPLIYYFFCFIFKIYRKYFVSNFKQNKYFYCDYTSGVTCLAETREKNGTIYCFLSNGLFSSLGMKLFVCPRQHCTDTHAKLAVCGVTCSLLHSVGQFAGSSAPHCDGSTSFCSPAGRPSAPAGEAQQRNKALGGGVLASPPHFTLMTSQPTE